MEKLIILDFILIAFIVIGLWLIKKYVKKECAQNAVLIAAALFTIVFHYSSLIFELLSGGDAMEYIKSHLQIQVYLPAQSTCSDTP